jgi:hypothetical protein
MKYTIAKHNNAVFVTVPQVGDNSLRDFCKKQKIPCSGYRPTHALTTINSSENVIVILRNPHQRYDSGMQFLSIGNNLIGMYIGQHTSPYLELFKDKKVRYMLFDKLGEYFSLDSDPELIVPIKDYPEVYADGELDQELETYNHIIDNNEELTVEEFNTIWQ